MAIEDTNTNETAENGYEIHVEAGNGGQIDLPSSDYVTNSEILRDGQDLVLEGPDGISIVVEGYFTADPAPTLQAPDGQSLSPKMVESFVQHSEPVQYADAGVFNDESPVGMVEEISGDATVTRTDGTTEPLTIGTPIYQGDIVETDEEGAVNITFVDETTLALSQNAKLAVDEYVFDPSSESGSTDVSILRGLFVFTSGLIGRDDPDDVNIDTPMGSIGIRGTIIAGNVDTGEITVMEGAIVLRGVNGSEMTLASPFETARFDPTGGEVQHMGVMGADTFGETYNVIRTVSPGFFSSIEETEEHGEPQEQAPALEPEAGEPTQDEQTQMQPAPEQQILTDTSFAGTTDAVITNPTTQLTAPDASGSTGTTSTTTPPPNTTTQTAPPPADSTVLPPPSVTGTGTNTGGGATGPTIVDLSNITAADGFGIYGSIGDMFGRGLVSLGDYDGDGIGNFLVINDLGTATVYAFNGTTYTGTVGSASSNNAVVANAGDFNGDGSVDFIVGAPLADGLATDAGFISGNTGITITAGLAASDHAGTSVAGLGDVNGDGLNDFIFGAPGTDNAGTDRGTAYIMFGDTSGGTVNLGSLSATQGSRIDNTTDNQLFGTDVQAAGDFNNDGYADILVSNFVGGSTGEVRMFMGGTSNVNYNDITDAVHTFTGIGTAGTDIPLFQMGDVNGDGTSDIGIVDTLNDLIHIQYGGGAVDTNLGDGVLNTNGFTIMNSGTGTMVGGGAAGDFNGDGYDDGVVIVRNGTVADVFVVYGKPGVPAGNLFDVQSILSNNTLGFHATYDIGHTGTFDFEVTAGGDLNADGFEDILFGTPHVNGGDGAIIALYGRNDLKIGADGKQTHIAYDTSPDNKVFANSDGQHLVGDNSNNELHDKLGGDAFGHANISMNGGGGNDLLVLNDLSASADTRNASNLGNIDGGFGYDSLEFYGDGDTLDFASVGSEGLKSIEALTMMGTGQTILIGIDDIFRLMQQSEDGTLKISANGDTTNRLLIENNGITNMVTGTYSATGLVTELDDAHDFANAGSVTHSTNAGYDIYTMGGYQLEIESVLLDATNQAQIV